MSPAMAAAPGIVEATDVLLVVDVQNDFCPGGALEVPEGDAVVGPVNRLATMFPHVVLTQDWHPRGHSSFASSHPGHRPFETIAMPYGSQVLWPDHCVQGTKGADFHPRLAVPHAELVIRKGFHPGIDSYSTFFENDRSTPTGLDAYLRRRELSRIFLAGLATDFCVFYSALDAIRSGFRVVVVEDACRALDLAGSLAGAKAEMMAAGITFIGADDVRRGTG